MALFVCFIRLLFLYERSCLNQCGSAYTRTRRHHSKLLDLPSRHTQVACKDSPTTVGLPLGLEPLPCFADEDNVIVCRIDLLYVPLELSFD